MNWNIWANKFGKNLLYALLVAACGVATLALTDLSKNPAAPVAVAYLSPALFAILKAVENWAKHRGDA